MKRIISVILTLCFTFDSNPVLGYQGPTLFTNKAHAQRHITDEKPKFLDISENPSLTDISQKYGKVLESYKGTNKDKIIIHIQDRHIDEIAQLNIASIIEELTQKYGIYLLSLEGASKELDTSFYDKFPDGNIKEKITKFFLKKGLFTGSEYYKITHRNQYLKATGAEDKALYLKHLTSYKENQIDKEGLILLAKAIRNAMEKLKDKIYSKDLKFIDEKSNQYKNKKIELGDYLQSVIARTASEAKQDEASGLAARQAISRYPNISLLLDLIRKEKQIDFSKAQDEREALIKELSQTLKQEKLKELLEKSMAFRLSKITEKEFYAYLSVIAITPQAGEHLLAYIDYIEQSAKIDYLALFNETEDLEEQTKKVLCKNDTQLKLAQYSKAVDLLLDLYNLKLNNEKLYYINSHPEYFDIKNIRSFIKENSNRYGLDMPSSILSADVDQESFKRSIEFYKIALKRDVALVENTLSDMKQHRKDKAILITGGFHTSGITNLLKQKGISYAVICPNVGTQDYEKIYQQRMAGEIPQYSESPEMILQTLVPALTTGDLADNRPVQQAFDRTFSACQDYEAGVKSFPMGGEDAGALRKEVEMEFRYDRFIPTQLRREDISDVEYHFLRNKYEILKMLEETNWYYQSFNPAQRQELQERLFDGLALDIEERIKELVSQETGISKEDILSIMLYGSWCYAPEAPSDFDIACVVKGNRNNEFLTGIPIKNKEQWFRQRIVNKCDMRIIGEGKLLEVPLKKDASAIDFEVSMKGHGILIAGKNYIRGPPLAHNLIMKARALLMLAFWYAEGRIKETVTDEEGNEELKDMSPAGILRKIEIRVDEAGRILKIVFSEKYLGEGNSETGIQPVAEALEEVENVLSALRAQDMPYDILIKELAEKAIPVINKIWQQTQFIEDGLVGLEVQRRSAGAKSFPMPEEQIRQNLAGNEAAIRMFNENRAQITEVMQAAAAQNPGLPVEELTKAITNRVIDRVREGLPLFSPAQAAGGAAPVITGLTNNLQALIDMIKDGKVDKHSLGIYTLIIDASEITTEEHFQLLKRLSDIKTPMGRLKESLGKPADSPLDRKFNIIIRTTLPEDRTRLASLLIDNIKTLDDYLTGIALPEASYQEKIEKVAHRVVDTTGTAQPRIAVITSLDVDVEQIGHNIQNKRALDKAYGGIYILSQEGKVLLEAVLAAAVIRVFNHNPDNLAQKIWEILPAMEPAQCLELLDALRRTIDLVASQA